MQQILVDREKKETDFLSCHLKINININQKLINNIIQSYETT